MLVFNQQANIKNVNGAIADTLANRPAAQGTFYIFYSIDTQEIYYDNGAWILIGSGGGGVNIYNSDGTLTGNRTLSGANNDLNFADLNIFKTSIGGNDIGLKLDFANQSYSIGDPGSSAGSNYFVIDDANAIITTGNNTGINGINLDLNNYVAKFGFFTTLNSPFIDVYDLGIISTNYGGVRLGLEFDYTTNIFRIGDVNTQFNQNVLSIEDSTNQIYLGKPGNVNLNIDNANSVFKTFYNANDIGLKLDFSNGKYVLGDEPTGLGFVFDAPNQLYYFGDYGQNGNTIEYNSSTAIVTSNFGFANQGLRFEMSNGLYQFGQITGSNQTYLTINDTTQTIKTTSGSTDVGLKLDFANNEYFLGNGVASQLEVYNTDIKTRLAGGVQGLWVEEANRSVYVGDFDFGYDGTVLITNYTSSFIKSQYQGNDIGLKLDFANTTYQLGQLTGGNTTYLTIDDAATYPVQIDGTNVLSGTSAGSSGQHLKIKINGTDYKIKLENP